MEIVLFAHKMAQPGGAHFVHRDAASLVNHLLGQPESVQRLVRRRCRQAGRERHARSIATQLNKRS